ncbi:hypothetical protein AGR1A_Lc100030 [Agrobacterium fabacearum CFBP 5771]|nr:hypothetical protein AGR1A_Lc100030 [Agrobacterium fabacearum CFBP 5771]
MVTLEKAYRLGKICETAQSTVGPRTEGKNFSSVVLGPIASICQLLILRYVTGSSERARG